MSALPTLWLGIKAGCANLLLIGIVRSAPWPSAVLKEEAKALVEQWAEAATPDFSSMVEHNSPLVLPTVSVSSLVRGSSEPALAFAEITDPRLLCWVLKEALLAKVYAGLDEVADDKAALSQQQREEMLAQIDMDIWLPREMRSPAFGGPKRRAR